MRDGHLCVLLIEDDLAYQEIITDNLEEMNCVVAAVETVQQGASLFHNWGGEIDIIIFDYTVKDGTTTKLIAEITTSGFTGMMVAAGGDPNDRTLQLEAGCQVEMDKHFGRRDLEKIIDLATMKANK